MHSSQELKMRCSACKSTSSNASESELGVACLFSLQEAHTSRSSSPSLHAHDLLACEPPSQPPQQAQTGVLCAEVQCPSFASAHASPPCLRFYLLHKRLFHLNHHKGTPSFRMERNCGVYLNIIKRSIRICRLQKASR